MKKNEEQFANWEKQFIEHEYTPMELIELQLHNETVTLFMFSRTGTILTNTKNIFFQLYQPNRIFVSNPIQLNNIPTKN